MPISFFDNFINIRCDRDFTPSADAGQISLINQSVAVLTVDNVNYKSDLILRSDFQTVGANVSSHIKENYTDFSGYNRKYIDEAGVYNPGLALEEHAKTGFERRVVSADTYALVSSMIQNDSHEAFLYNMLVTWYKSVLYRMNKGSDYKFYARLSPYEDSHVVVSLGEGFEDQNLEIELTDPSLDTEISSVNTLRRTVENYWRHPYVLHYNGSSNEQEAFYLVHLAGRSQVSPLNFDVIIPNTLAGQTVLLDPVNPRVGQLNTLDLDVYTKSETIWAWIIDYVRLNRVEQGFAAALECLSALAFQPLWESAEACAWQHAQIQLTLPQFQPTRARIRSNLTGEAYTPYQSASEFVLDAARAPSNFVQSSAVLNYISWYGLYTLLHNDARSRQDWRVTLTSNADELQVLCTPSARSAAIAVVTGQQVTTCMNDGMYVSYNFSPMSEISVLKVVKTKDALFAQTGVLIDALVAPVSGALLLGTFVDTYETTTHLTGVQKFESFQPYGTYLSLRHALKLANLYRLFGHNLTLQHTATGEQFTPWASSQTCIIEPSAVAFDPAKPNDIVVVTSTPREGRNCPLPHIAVLARSETVTLTIQMPSIDVVKWKNRRSRATGYTSFTRTKITPIFNIRSAATVSSQKFHAKPVFRPVDQPQDFRKQIPTITPEKPEITITPVTPEPPSAPVHTESNT